MRLPQRPTNLDVTTAPIVDSVLLELFEIRRVHELNEIGACHRVNRRDAALAHDEVRRLLSDAPDTLEDWARRAGYVADVMMSELIGGKAA